MPAPTGPQADLPSSRIRLADTPDPVGPVAALPDLALFDFDGTITTRETFPDLLVAATPRWRRIVGRVLLAPIVIAYRLGLLSGIRTRAALVRYAFSGLPAAHVAAAGAMLAATRLPALVRPRMQARIDWHRARGDTVVVVSGNLDLMLAPWCAAQGVALLCSTLEQVDGRLTGRYAGAQCAGDEKAKRVHAAYPREAFAQVYAYGDTDEDLALLRIADHVIWRGAPWATTT
ncbi:HAD-IB family hydrolase [Luteimonas sp. S4-F44]|uniref:HAD-IB family hydrolase n=1 Tax=Luteimonas sp. S4-F44 TaxID=2925842 RepID=UPI001F52B95D|nr:HAD-IB family hydrolase [Luteimonas sp. S4-F44]UNK42184.1 HAD-IB family hydrolase [Luteimonas sp. S4-F44]